MSNEIVLITGASSGIGWELAKLFAADGSELILVARRLDRLEELSKQLQEQHGTTSTLFQMDLSVPGSAEELFSKVQDTGKQVDVLVNNAGFGQIGRFEEISLDRQTSMCELNIVTLTQLTHLFLNQMVPRDSGAILNIGSTASFQPGPNAAVYYATKAYVLSFSEALHAELWGKNISVTCLCPGPTKTGFGDDSDMGSLPMFKNNIMEVESVAKAGYRGLRKKKRLIVPGIFNNLLAFSNRFAARPIPLWIVKRMQTLPKS
ncbi:SDR family NAD(P)-dependent oxidoreductase [Thalassoglobus polymorphus]|uniref:Sulfoacetaldehyde reductase n=1 Tax=Thalassoglobus polymorphus TaxID=2527994 RepID=A0A517QM07_9PLAN|nr:SDR family oxidoreductase [Thalassoglobus polymorphus]QDT32664.1 Sulfoacetaldehyde reductase [Thalassoglobus polymorphus]